MTSTSEKPASDTSRWICIYPVYLNSLRTLGKGRRIGKEIAVENPTAKEIYDVLHHHKLNCILEEHKLHPREPSREGPGRGRVKVQLKDDDGNLLNKDYPNRGSLLRRAALDIPFLITRKGSAQAPAAAPSASGGKGGKKNKKR